MPAPVTTYLGILADALTRLCSLRHRTGAVDRWIARDHWAIFAALARQAGPHASDRVRTKRRLAARPPLHHRSRNLRRSALGVRLWGTLAKAELTDHFRQGDL